MLNTFTTSLSNKYDSALIGAEAQLDADVQAQAPGGISVDRQAVR